jgi:hypothetical protein
MARATRDNERSARAAVSIAAATARRWQLPAQASFVNYDHRSQADFVAGKRTRRNGSQSDSNDAPNGNETGNGKRTASAAQLIQAFVAKARALNATARATDSVAQHRATLVADAGGPFARKILELSPAIDALSQVLSNEEWSPRSDAGVSSRSQEGLEAQRAAFTGAGFIANARIASSICGMVPPRNLVRREFAEPSGNARGPGNSGVGAGITVNSSPTVVINGPTAGSNLQRDVLGALRAHREELFDQLKRESARRERTQF